MLKFIFKNINNRMFRLKENAIEPLIAYTLPTFILVLPTFTINQLNLPTWLSFAIASIPFSGRIIGSLVYQYLLRILGSRLIAYISLASLGVLSASDGIYENPAYLLFSRFLIGIFFGISTSLAINEALISQNRLITGLTMGGWAIGWIAGSIDFIILHYWEIIAISGLITIPFVSTFKTNFKTREIRYQFPPITAILVYFLAFEPAFALTLAPYILEEQGENVLLYMIASYALSLPMYLYGYKLEKYFPILLGGISISSLMFFYFNLPLGLLIFTSLGLGINSISPSLAQKYGANPLNSGIALNIAAIGGTIIPIVFANMEKYIAFLTIICMGILLYLANKKHLS